MVRRAENRVETLQDFQRRVYLVRVRTNSDRDAIQALTSQLPLCDALLFTAELAGCYKPDRRIYRMPCYALGIAPGQILHIAGSPIDVMGASAAGLRCVWCNRSAEPAPDPTLLPEQQLASLSDLPNLLP